MKYAIFLLLLAVCLSVSAQQLPDFPCTCTSPADSISPHPRIRWADSTHSEEIYISVPDASPALRKENVYASGLLRFQTVSVWQDSGWKCIDHYAYHYNDLRQRIAVVFWKMLPNGLFEPIHQDNFTYNEKGEMSTRERIECERCLSSPERNGHEYDPFGDVQIVHPGQ